MASKLTEITTKYHTFVDNQVLTKDQLNEFVSYLDDQDRLSRVFLSGVGVVCGFKVSKSGTGISLTPGVGITTDGDLIQLKETNATTGELQLVQNAVSYSHYKVFDDDAANYSPFRKLVNLGKFSDTRITMYELVSAETENALPISGLAGWGNMVVLLYLESYGKEGDLCTAIDCDNQGIEEVNKLRILLIPKADADYLASKDSIYSSHNVFDSYFNLPSVAVKRVVLNQTNSSKYEELKRAYYDAITDNSIVANLCKGLFQIYSNFESLLQTGVSVGDLKSAITDLKDILTFSAYRVPFNIQYCYDFLKDVVDTYNELKALLLDLNETCFPDIKAFPKHLFLGYLPDINLEPIPLRHDFYKSPAVSCGNQKILQARSLMLRMVELINQFGTISGDIKITPSNKLPELSKRTIPYYYGISANLLKSWDYFKSRRFKEDTNLCYHTAKLANEPHIQEPLDYNTDSFDFYRIEGHQGQDYRDVLEKLAEYKTRYGLSFDVKALSVNINSETLDVDDYECEFEDLKVMLKAWTAEQDCILAQVSNFFSGFSTAVPGTNVKEAELDIRKKEIANYASINIASAKTTAAVTSELTKTITATSSVYQPIIASKVVEENLITTENTLGVEVKKAIEANVGGSVNDIIATASNNLKDIVDTEEWNAAPDLKEFVVDKSVELLAHTHVLTQRMPTEISIVDTPTITQYKLSLSQLCSLVAKLKASYQSSELSEALRAYMGLLINQLSTICCSGKKLEILLEEVNTRKDQILARLQLSKFIEQHPGLEHKAGVEPGGTFVLVYKNSEVVSDKTATLTEKLTADTLVTATDLNVAKLDISEKILNIDSLSTVEKTSLLKTTTSLLKYESYLDTLSRIETLEKVIVTADVPDNTVVADFALPYMCCSDCASINYIMAKPAANLRLEKDRYCLLSDTDPILFDVTPSDGEVKTDPAVAGIKIEDNKLVIMPDSFPADMIGETIRFTVNSQVTDAELIVYQGVQAEFTVPEEPTAEATHSFDPTGTNLEGATFFWEFGDGKISNEQSPTHTYELPVNDDNKVTVTLMVTAANGICKTVVEHAIVFEEVKPVISLEENEYCENDKSAYPFTVTPPNSKVEITGSGVEKDGEGGFVFIPAAAALGEIEFILNGEASGLSVTVYAAPQASCEPKQVDNQLIISNNSKNANKFEWKINGNEIKTETLDPITIDLTADSENLWEINLIAYGAAPCPPSATSVEYETKYIEEPPVNTCEEEAKAAMLTDGRALQKFVPIDTGIVGDAWNRTLKLYGGMPDYKEGILDNVDAFLSGEENDRLGEFFLELINYTGMMAVEMMQEKEISAQLMELLEYQLRLFYNVLGCQNNDLLKRYEDIISQIFKQIIETLTLIKEYKLVFSETMKQFIAAYAKRVEKIDMLRAHIEVIISQNLI